MAESPFFVNIMDTSQSEFVDCFVRIATGQVGVIEHGQNRGKQVQAYQSATYLDGTGWSWCAAFVCWCMEAASLRFRPSFTLPTTPRAFEFESWGERAGLLIREPRAILRGDLVIFEFSHIGIAIADSVGRSVETVEGNTHSDESSASVEGVYVRNRNLSRVRSIVRL